MLAYLAVAPLGALDPLRRTSDYIYAEWNTSHGLPYTAVRGLHQDATGYLWTITRGGLARFDGVKFTAFTHENTPVLADDEIHALADGPDGTLWLATNQGVVWHRDGRWWQPAELKELEGRSVRWLERDGADMWIGMADAILIHRDGGLVPAPLPDTVKFANLRNFTRAADGEMVILAEPHWHIQKAQARRIVGVDGEWRNWVYGAIHHPQRGWWIGSDAGIFHLQDGLAERIPTIAGIPIATARSLYIDRHDTLWIGTRGELYRLAQGRLDVVERPGVDAIGNFLCLLEDREGNLWGGNDSGLLRFGDVKASFIGPQEGLQGRSTVSVITARDGSLWTGIWGGGLTHLSPDGRVLKTYRTGDGLPSDAVMNLCEAPDGSIWMSLLNECIARLDTDGRITRIDHRPFTTNRAHDMVCDRTGTLWLATVNHSLVRASADAAAAVPLGEGIFVSALLVDSRDRLWVAWRGGLGRPDPATGQWLERYDIPPGEGTVAVEMLEDRAGDIWVFREGMTVQRLRQGRIEKVVLPSHVGRLTYSALIRQDDLWINFRNGIVRLPVAQFESAVRSEGSVPEFDFLREADGLRSLAPNTHTGTGATLGTDGQLYFTTSRGLAVIDPARIHKKTTPPSIVIETVLVDRVPHTPAATADLAPGRGEIEIQFTALALSNAQLNQFRHRLLPVDETWSTPGTERTVHYGSLPAGEYRFELLAANADGVWTPQPTVLTFRLPPHFYQTWWFTMVLVLALPAGIWLFVRQREATLRSDKRRLEEGIASRTLELHESNRKLTLQVQETARKAAALEESREHIRALNEELESRVAARTAELQTAIGELEAFTYSVSHDLRGPLRGIDGWSLAILEEHGAQLDPAALAHLNRVRGETQRLAELIDDLLMLSRTTRAELKPVALDLSALALHTAARVAAARAEAKVAFSCQPGLLVRGDTSLIEAALYNLFDNAWKFSLGATQPRVEFGLTDTGRGPAFFLRDNGAGFDMRHVRRLFGVFQRLHTQDEFPGTGVGLAVVQRIIQRHGGTIWAESAPGRGATFFFTIGS